MGFCSQDRTRGAAVTIRRRARSERGAALVEFAIIAPLLFMLLFGMLTGGLVMDRRLSTSGASREAARYGATRASDQCESASNCAGRTWAQHVQNVAVTRAGRGIEASDVCVALVEDPGSAPSALSSSHIAGGSGNCYVDDSADVGPRVQVRIPPRSPIRPGGPGPPTVSRVTACGCW
ncbi:hypothetical protein BH23ACT2_BH23ACT2_25690 [soil metagenome]